MLDVKQTLNGAEERMQMAAMFLEEELNRVRAGRANVAILDGVRVESYGSRVPLNRRDLVKQCNKICEKAKVEVRNVRGDIKEKLKKAIKDGLSEDNEKDAEAELQKLHDKWIKKLDELMEAKNKEIMTV